MFASVKIAVNKPKASGTKKENGIRAIPCLIFPLKNNRKTSPVTNFIE